MNFQSILEELDRLYEELPAKEAEEETEVVEECDRSLKEADEEILVDDEPIIDDEAEVEESEEEAPEVEEVSKQVVIECSKCGALVIKDEADIKVDEETDLVNVDEECQICEETEGYKIVGTIVPYEAVEADAEPIDSASAKNESEESEVEGEELTELFGFNKKEKYPAPEMETKSLPSHIKPMSTKSIIPDGYVIASRKGGAAGEWFSMEPTVYRDEKKAWDIADKLTAEQRPEFIYSVLNTQDAAKIFGDKAKFQL